MTDDERMARYEAHRQHATPKPAWTPLAIARHYAAGNTLSDDEIAMLQRSDPACWTAAVDEAERTFLLRPPSPPPESAPPVVLRTTTPREAVSITSALSRIERLIAAPTEPVYNEHGTLVGARKVPLEPEDQGHDDAAHESIAEPPPAPVMRAREGDYVTRSMLLAAFKALAPHLKEDRDLINELGMRLIALEHDGPTMHKPHYRYIWMRDGAGHWEQQR